MILGIDTGTRQRNLDFAEAFRVGVRVCYVKMGGDNVSRYVAPHYAAQVDKARAVRMLVGHYWVPGDADPVGAADYFVDRLRNVQSSDFYVLDNEKLDSGRMYSDHEAALWVRRVSARLGVPTSRVFMYAGAADLRGRSWPETEATGARLIIASYGANSGTRDHEPNPGGRWGNAWAGHQYTSRGNIGGVVIDLNLFQDWAFDGIGAIAVGPTPSAASAVASPWEPSGELGKRVQAALKSKNRYAGPVDGVFGPATRKGVQTTLKVSRIFDGLIDGVLGSGAARGIQAYAKRFGDYTGPQDGDPRSASWAGFALGLERP